MTGKGAMTAKLLLTLIMLIPAAIGAEETGTERYYVSNQLGMALEQIGWYRQEEFSYVLVVKSVGNTEIRTLLHEGQPLRRWEEESGEQRVYRGSELEERRKYDERDRLIEEQLYEGGRLDRRTVYSYVGDVLERTETYGPEGSLLFRDEYRLSADGRLRRVTRRQGENQPDQRLALGEGSRGAAEERYGNDRERRINHFDPTGRLVQRETWVAGELIERETFEYRDEVLHRSVLEELPTERTTVRRYDPQGRVEEERVIEKGEQSESTLHVRDPGGRIVESIRRGQRGIEKWRFEYGAEGELQLEEYRVKGSLERISRFSRREGERYRVDELYREGELFMRVHYRSEQMVKEEFVRNGEIVRVREYR